MEKDVEILELKDALSKSIVMKSADNLIDKLNNEGNLVDEKTP